LTREGRAWPSQQGCGVARAKREKSFQKFVVRNSRGSVYVWLARASLTERMKRNGERERGEGKEKHTVPAKSSCFVVRNSRGDPYAYVACAGFADFVGIECSTTSRGQYKFKIIIKIF
jgi:hypothetical protein